MKLGEIRIVLPMVILDELDKVKYMKGDRADRAASVAKGSYSASVIVLQESGEDVIRALTCRLGCHLRSDLSSPTARNGCPLALGRIAGRAGRPGHSVGCVADTQPGLVRRIQAGSVRLAYRTWGPAGAPPLVLLHALGGQSSDWAPVAQALASWWRVYAPGLRGHGASDWAGPYTIEQLAADLAALLDALELERVALGGHSVGGPPACLYAARHPGRVTRLVLEDPAPPWPREPRVLARPEGPLPFGWDVTALSNEFTDPQASSWRDELRRIQAPALVIAGGPASHVDQGQLAGMAALIPDCELVTIPAGHLVHAVRPAGFTAAVTAFPGTRGT